MRISVRILCAALSFLAIARTAQALTWNELQQKAIEANPDLRSLKADTESKDYLRKADYGSYWPQLFLIGEEDKHNGKNPAVNFDAPTNTFSLINNKYYSTVDTYGVKSTLQIFSGFATVAAVARSTADFEASTSRYLLRSIDLRYTLATNYIQWLMAQQSAETSNKILVRLRQNLGLIKIKYDNGLEARWAVDQADIEVQLAEVRLQQDNQHMAEAAANINQLLESPVALEPDPSVFKLTPLVEPTATEIEQHPQIRYYQSLVAGAEADKKLGRAGYYPHIDASYTWSNTWEKDQGTFKDNYVALTLTWNIFDGFSTTNRVRGASAAAVSAQLSQEAFRNQLKSDLAQQKKNYDLAVHILDLKRLQLKNAETRANTVNSQYQNGLRRYDDWEAAQTRLIDLERERLDYEQQALLLKVSWEKNIGLKLGDL